MRNIIPIVIDFDVVIIVEVLLTDKIGELGQLFRKVDSSGPLVSEYLNNSLNHKALY